MKLRAVVTTVAILSISFAVMGEESTTESNRGRGQGQHQRRGGNGNGENSENRGERLREALDLSDEQFEQLQALKTEHREEMQGNREAVQALRAEVKTELKKDSPSSSETDRLAEEIGDLHTEMTKSLVAHLLEIKEILTPEQFEKMGELHQGRRGGQNGRQGRNQ